MSVHYFHCTPDRTDHLTHYPNQIRILASAWRLKLFFGRMKRHIHLAKELFIDSGMISAWKKGQISWADNQDYVIQTANALDADYVSMLDLPMEPHMLSKNGVESQDALRKTLRNALAFMNANVCGVKVFVIQGYELSEYQQCIEAYRNYGVFDMADVWIAIGSVCMRSPKKGLYDVCRFVRQAVPHHPLHAFGVGRKEWIRELRNIGINSFDSSYASTAVAFNRGKTRIEGKRNDSQVVKQFADEMVIYERYLNDEAGVVE